MKKYKKNDELVPKTYNAKQLLKAMKNSTVTTILCFSFQTDAFKRFKTLIGEIFCRLF